MKNILIPTDFSDGTWSSIIYALKLLKHETCNFYLLHANKIYPTSFPSMTDELTEEISKKPFQELEELKEQLELADTNANHEFTPVLKLLDLVTAIENCVEEFNIDFVVMSTKGATGAKEIFMGSNTVKTINNMHLCPILVIPDGYDYVQPKQIAFPSDFNRFYRREEIKPLRELVELYNSKVRIVHINTEEELDDIQEFNKDELNKHLESFEHTFHWMPDFAKKAEVINVFIEDLEIDILAMINYKHSFIQKLVREPVIKKLGFHPKVPFMVIPEKKVKA